MADKKTDFEELFGRKEAPKSGFSPDAEKSPGGFSAEAERICRAQGE